MTISEKALADLLFKHLTTLEPVGKDVTLKNEMKKVAQPDGSTKAQMVPKKGDLYIPKDLSNAMAKAIAKALKGHLDPFLRRRIYRKSTTPVTASGTISPWAPTFIGALETTITAEEGDWVRMHLGTHDGEQPSAVIAQMYLGITLDGVDSASNLKSVHAYLIDGQVDFPMSLTWIHGPLSKGSHVLRAYCAKYQGSDNNWSCRWPFFHIEVFRGEPGA